MTTTDVLGLLAGWEPSAPRLVWYGDGGERVELSGRVLGNWVVKAGNLLATGCDAGPGAVVVLDLPAHWRLLVWALGARAVGADVAVGGDPGPTGADVVVTSRPDAWAAHAPLAIAVPLPALARAWPGTVPPGAIDGAADLMAQPDVPVFAALPGGRPPRAVTGAVLLVDLDPAALVEAADRAWLEDRRVVLLTPRPSHEVDAIAAQENARR